MVKACRVKQNTKTNKRKQKFYVKNNLNNVAINVNISSLNMESSFVDMSINVIITAVGINVNMEDNFILT